MINPGDSFGNYTVVKRLGKGGMGEVWLLEAASGAQVAAKILDPETSGDHEARKRFLREAQLALGVKHPNLVETYDVGEDPDTGLCYILMEYVPGGTLADYLKENGALPIEDAVAVVEAIAGVLELGRQKGIVHRDIKPANIMFAEDGTPKLADLGIARGGVSGTDATTVTQTGMMIGTPAYMAPEQMLDAHNVDTRADIYSLGVVFFEMLTGERPNKDDTVVQLMAKAVKGEPLPDVRALRPEVSASLAQLLGMMVAPDREGRISTPGQITNALGIIERGGKFVSRVELERKQREIQREALLRKRAQRRRLMVACVGAVIAALIAAVVVLATAPSAPVRTAQKTVVVTNAVTNVVNRIIEKKNVFTNIVSKDVAPTKNAGRIKDGTYKCEGSDGEWTYSVKNGKLCLGDGEHTALYPMPAGRVRLPASLNGLPVNGIAKRAFFHCDDLLAVEVPEGYEMIGRDAFCGCKALEMINLPKSMTFIDSFAICDTKIHSLDLNRTSKWNWNTIGGTPCLEEIHFDSRNNRFSVDDGLVLSKDKKCLMFVPRGRKQQVIPSTVTFINGHAFSQGSIRSLVIPENVREIHMFAASKCNSMQALTIGRGVRKIGKKAFEFATNLESLTFEEGLQDLDEWAVFWNCHSLREVKLPDTLESLGPGLFENATSLENIRFGRSFRRIGFRTFAGDVSLKEVRLPGTLSEMGAECFRDCRLLRSVHFEGNAPKLVDNGNAQRGVDIFMGTPRDLVVYVKRGCRGWRQDGGEGLPDRWPVGAGGNARKIQYLDDIDARKGVSMDDSAGFDWLVHPQSPRKNAEILVGFSTNWRKPESYFSAVAPGVKVTYLQNDRIPSHDLKSVALAFMYSCAGSDRELEEQNVRRMLEQGINVVFVAHTPRDMRERFLNEYGLCFDHIQKDAHLEGVCPGLQGVPMRWMPMGQGCIVDDKAGWRRMIAAGDGRQASILAMRSCGNGRLFFLANSRELDDGRIDFNWWNRILRGLGIATNDGLNDRSMANINADKLKDSDSTRAVQKALDVMFPGWKTSRNAVRAVHPNEALGYIQKIRGHSDVVATLPPSKNDPVVLSKTMVLPANAKLSFAVRKNPTAGGGFTLQVCANGKRRWEGLVCEGRWIEQTVDLSDLSGQKTKLEIRHLSHPDYGNARALWSRLEVK